MITITVRWLTRARFAVALSALAMLLASTGCQERSTPAPQSSTTAAIPASPGDAGKLLAEMVDAYKTATSYEDAGELHITAESDDGQKEESPPIPFSVAFERPNKFRVHSLQASVVGDGQKLRATADSLSDQVLVLPVPEQLSAEIFSADELLESSMRGQIGLGLPQISLLLDADPLKTLAEGDKPVVLEDATFQDEMCHRVSVQGPQGTAVFWIDRKSHLLRKYEFPSAEFKQNFSLAKCSIWAEFNGAQTNTVIAADAFKMEIPASAKLLKQFFAPPPEPPSPLLARTPDNFVFIDLKGSPVERDSLKDKVVVLDMWATWCGWCFKGFPNLEKVYQQFKDNDKVVILAVNKDEPTVSDAAVQGSFDKASLHIPIVRDQQKLTDRVFQAENLPTMVILGADGTVQVYHMGYDANLAETLPKKIKRLLAGENLAKEEIGQYEQEQKEYEQKLSEALVDDTSAGSSDVAEREPSAE
ncbi:MAG: redoxin domain-containing protein [Planctomycetia bacterium]|nr:redoxin domain-containing protein [Planctomycetia bacterium]